MTSRNKTCNMHGNSEWSFTSLLNLLVQWRLWTRPHRWLNLRQLLHSGQFQGLGTIRDKDGDGYASHNEGGCKGSPYVAITVSKFNGYRGLCKQPQYASILLQKKFDTGNHNLTTFEFQGQDSSHAQIGGPKPDSSSSSSCKRLSTLEPANKPSATAKRKTDNIFWPITKAWELSVTKMGMAILATMRGGRGKQFASILLQNSLKPAIIIIS